MGKKKQKSQGQKTQPVQQQSVPSTSGTQNQQQQLPKRDEPKSEQKSQQQPTKSDQPQQNPWATNQPSFASMLKPPTQSTQQQAKSDQPAAKHLGSDQKPQLAKQNFAPKIQQPTSSFRSSASTSSQSSLYQQHPQSRKQQQQYQSSRSNQQQKASTDNKPSQKQPQESQSQSSHTSLVESSIDGSIYEGTRGKQCKVEVNYGKISLNHEKFPKIVYQYDITFDPPTPKKLLSSALNSFMEKKFPSIIYVSDDRKSLYTRKRIDDESSGVVEVGPGDRPKKFKIKVKFTSKVDMSVLLNYKSQINNDEILKPIQVLNIIMKSAYSLSLQQNLAIKNGKNVYFVPDKNQQIPLGDSMELWYSLFQSFIVGRKDLYLNIDISQKAFTSNVTVLEFIRALGKGRIPDNLQDWQFRKLKNHLSKLNLTYELNPGKSYKFFDLTRGNSTSEKMKMDNETITIYDYFNKFKGKKLNYPNLPLIWVGSRAQKVLLPLEFCAIPAGQVTRNEYTSQIIKHSAISTTERKKKILDLTKKVSYATNSTISSFGIEVKTDFQVVDARVIDPPDIKYKNEVVTPKAGEWNEGDFIESVRNEIKWFIINCNQKTSLEMINKFKEKLIVQAKRQNIVLRGIQSDDICTFSGDPFEFIQWLRGVLDNCKKNDYKYVLVVVNEKNYCYERVKQIADLEIDIVTQCIIPATIEKVLFKGDAGITTNILLQLNAKLNGTNHEIQEESFNSISSGVMLIGADVTHPSPDQKFTPSVVGVVSSFCSEGFKHRGDYRLQQPTKEMIIDMENIVVDHLQFYKSKNNGRLPDKILYYRDGVSDGQFKEALDIEFTAIRNAMKRVYGITESHAKVTFVVVQKRHNMRLFPLQKEFMHSKFKNVVPGTIVDKDVVHPFHNQFALASHVAIQGVTRPTKYCVLVNESKISPDDIQAITYDLCHLYARCNRTVSYPTPTYYAHLFAERGKVYITGDNISLNNLDNEYKNRQIKQGLHNFSPMFFI